MSLPAGTRLGPYEIVSLLGAGGMGEVYRATDTVLKRQIALKVLPTAVAGDPERVARFQREAEVLAALNHPNIAHIHGLERADATLALVMELVEGPTLADRIAAGPIPMEEALPLARQIAEALEGAHERGIIHRDLKPANIKVREDGTVKVLDFGLAKIADSSGLASGAAAGQAGLTESPTITTPAMTAAGMILGTAAYMSPEQAKGRPADKRSDIWAFGCVLFEMLTGRRAFEGADVSDTLAAILRGEPDWAALTPRVPVALRTLLQRCLVKDPRQRLQAIGEARIAVERQLANPGVEPLVQTQRQPHPWLWPTVAAACLLVAVGVLGWTGLRQRPSLQVMRFEIQAPQGSVLPLGTPAFSPDGRALAYTVTGPDHITRIHVRSLDATQSRALPGTENAIHPFWSPDGRSLAFAVIGGIQLGSLRRIDLASGAINTLTDVTGPWHGTWNLDGTILFTQRSSINGMSADGGRATVVASPNAQRGEQTIGFPHFLFDGKRFLVRVTFRDDRASVELATLGSSERTVLIPESRSAPIVARTPDGRTYVLYIREPDLLAQEFNETTGKAIGNGVVLVNNIGRVANPNDLPTVGVSSTGMLAYQTDSGQSGVLAWFDRSGQRVSELSLGGMGESPVLSPDGRFAAVEKRTGTSSDIWLVDLVRGSETRLTFSSGLATAPSWSPDGKRVVYHLRSKTPGMYEIEANGNGQERALTPTDGYPLSWSSDGKYLLYRAVDEHGPRLFLLSLTSATQSMPVTSLNGVAPSGAISSDGRFIAFTSNESGRPEIYVQPMPPATGKNMISVNGGAWPRWRRDGKELFFLSPDRKMMAADVDPGATRVGIPHELFQTSIASISIPRSSTAYDVSADGQRFLMYSTGKQESAPITIVQNWQEELKQRVPTR
jgi:serine/threonine protein kinase/Tol biopolymer transport system component